MNREIKFRIWSPEHNSFWFDALIHQTGRVFQMYVGYTLVDPPDNLIVQQYTGLKDQEGKEIYEGDILKYEYSQAECSSFASLESPLKFEDLYVVEYRDGAFRYKNEKYGDIHEDCLTMRVVGNIFENLQLLWTEDEKETM